MRFGRFGLWCLGAVVALLASPGFVSAATTFLGGAIAVTTQGGEGSATETGSSTATASGATGTVATATVEIQGVSSNGTGNNFSLAGVGFVLQAPGGQALLLLAGTGTGTENLSGLNITIQDGQSAAPNATSSGWSGTSATVEPSSYWTPFWGTTPPAGMGTLADWPQTDGSATLNGKFGGASADGTWTLSMVDADAGPISITGWSITLTYNAAASTTTTVSSNLNPSFTTSPSNTVTLTATVTSNTTVSAGTVAFSANGLGIAGCGAQAVSSGEATCNTTFSTQGINSITAAYSGGGGFAGSTGSLNELVEVHPTVSGTQFCNNVTLFVPGGTGTPTQMAYPSLIGVPTSVTNSVGNVTVQLNSMTTPSNGISNDHFLLVAPNGQNLDFLDGGFEQAAGSGAITLTFSDTAGQSVPSASTAPTTGTYLATDNLGTQTGFPAQIPSSRNFDSNIPAIPSSINYAQPSGGSGALNLEGAFSGAPAAGEWALYVINASGGGENISVGGWCLNLTLNSGAVTTTAIQSSVNPATTGASVTFTATVKSSGNPVTSGTVTFEDVSTSTILASGVALNASGQAVTSIGSLTEGDHKIIADYSGVTGTFDPSTASLWQREDDSTVASTPSGDQIQFCNTGNILLPAGSGGPENIGAANPNPSNIFVAGLPGTINSLTVTLKGFYAATDTISNISSLLVGPNGSSSPTTAQTLDFFSETGDSNSIFNENLTFTDSAASLVPQSAFGTGSYKPTSYATANDTFFASPSGFYTLPGSFQYAATRGTSVLGSPSEAGVFGGTSASVATGNGTWSLYFNQSTHADGNGATNGWCLNFTENPPALSATEEGPMDVTRGTSNSVTVVVNNLGPGSAGGAFPISVADTFPAGLTPTSGSGTSWVCGTPVGQTITCKSTEFIPSGSSFDTLNLNFNVASNATGLVTDNSTVSESGLTAGVKSNTVTIDVVPPPSLSVSKSHTGIFTQGETAEWDISVSNTSTNSTTSGTTTVSDTLPAGYTLNSYSSGGNVWTCGSIVTVVTCTSTQALSGGSSFPTLKLSVNVPANSPTSVSNTASAFGGGDLVHTSSGTAATSNTDTVTVVQTPASIVVSSGSGQSTDVNTAFANPLVAKVTDAASQPISGVSVTLAAPTSGASAIFTSTNPATTNASGLASVNVSANGIPGGPYTVNATAGSLITSPGFSLTNTGVATVTNVTSTTANGTYGVGASINVSVTFSKAVNVTGTPLIALNSGGTASYASGTGSATLSFTYSVGAGQNSSHLDYTSSTALTPNGGTIADLSATPATLTLPAPGAAGSLSANTNIVIDTTPPTVTNVTSSTANGTYGVGASINVSVTFSKAVNVTGTPLLALNSGGTASYASGSSSATLSFTYSVGAGQNSSHLDYTSTSALTLNGGTVKDSSAMAAVLTLPAPGAAGSLGANKSIVINTPAPTVTNVTSSTANGTYGVGASINVSVTFSGTVNVTGTPLLALNSGGMASYATGSGSATLSFTYTVGGGQNSSHLDYTSTGALTLNGGTITDSSSTAATLTLPAPGAAGSLGANKSIVIDTTAPTVVNVTSSTANGTYGVAANINVSVTFSKAVNVTGIPLIALNSGGTASYVSGSGTATLAFNYPVMAGQNSSHLDYTSSGALTPNGGTITGAGATPATLILPTPGAAGSLSANTNIVIDTTAPAVVAFDVLWGSQSYNVIGASRTAHLPWSVAGITVVFSKPIATASAASLGGISATGLSGLGTNTLTWTFTGITNATLSTTLAGSGANAIKDAGGNALAGGSGFSQAFSVLYGDFTGDGVVTAADLLGVGAAEKQAYNVFADLNGDGVVNAADVTIVKAQQGATQH